MKHWLSQIELGKWYSNAQYYYRPRNDKERNLMHNCYEEGYNKGYEEGKPKWHDLRKDSNDLPKHSGEYWCKWKDGTYSTVHYFGDNGFGNYVIADSGFGSYVIAWCEFPLFEE